MEDAFSEDEQLCRFVTSFATTDEHVAGIAALI
jgi:threonine aldolase